MNKILQILFSWPAALIMGAGTITLLVLLISAETSVQPYQTHPWAEENVTPPLIAGAEYRQTVVIPEVLADGTFLVGLFFGVGDVPGMGGAKISLTQGSQSQTHKLTGLAPNPTLRKRIEFVDFSGGAAELTIAGLAENSAHAPGLLFIREGEGVGLEGPGLEGPAYASIDWFKIVEGSEKLSLTFPSRSVSLLWLLPFAGFLTLAWMGLKPAKAE